MNNQQRIGIILIIIGGLILLNQFQILSLSGKNLVGITSVLLGLLMIKKSFVRPKYKGLLGGSFFVIWGILLLAFKYTDQPLAHTLFFGNLFLSLGLANLIYFIFSGAGKSIHLFIFLLFASMGGTMIAAYYGKLDVWQLEDILDTYWPVILILLGVFILVDSYRGRRKDLDEVTEERFPPGQE